MTGRPTERPQPMPPEPVYDARVPWWHADLWVEGTRVTVDRHVIELGQSRAPRRVRINQGPGGLRAWVDGRLRGQDPGGRHQPVLGSDRRILELGLTSHLSDETVYWVAPTERVAWSWGGEAPLEIKLAVRGSCVVRAGSEEQRTTSPVDRFVLCSFHVPGGAESISVTGEAGGAEVTDLFVAAR